MNKPGKLTPKQKANLNIVCLVAEDNSWLYIEVAANKIDAMVYRELQRESARIIQAVKKLKLKKGA
jgi:acyl-coenzyme A synthetase/AMP-(fatty) acid ligase